MKKVNIVTYCTYKSLGSILQAYGLQKQLNILGHKSSILMYKSENQFIYQKVNSIKSFCKKIYEIVILRKIRAAYHKRINFIDNNISIKYFNDYKEVIEKAKEEMCNTYMAGSDQVWQPDNCNPLFFLDFVKDNKRISYAASMGKTEIPLEKKEVFQKLINNFDYISVREEECADIIKNMTQKEVRVHIDPTFLISAEEWRKISSPYNVKEPYILLYMLYWDKKCKEKIKKFKRKTGLKVLAIADGLSNVYADKVLYDIGVEEFLWLIDHAEYIITSSFHGTAFATIFNKKFSAIINPKAPSRITNLLKKLSLPTVDINELITTSDFDYEKTNQLILIEKNKSIDYLKKVIE